MSKAKLFPLLSIKKHIFSPKSRDQMGGLWLESMDPGMVWLVGRIDFCGAARDSDRGPG